MVTPSSKGDFLKLHRVLANLLDNAVRHSPDGGTITVDVGGDGSEAFLSVTDEGAGVPVEDRTRVFERFVRMTTETPSNEGKKRGPGIGLYVVKGLVEAHGGSVSVEEGGRSREPEPASSSSCLSVVIPAPTMMIATRGPALGNGGRRWEIGCGGWSPGSRRGFQ